MIRVRSIGECSIEVGETRLTPSAETAFAVALYLVMESGRPVARAELIRLMWPGAPARHAAHSLRQVIYRLRSHGAVIIARDTDLVLPARSYEGDCLAVLAAHESPALEALADGVTGGFLPGYTPAVSRRFTEWLDHQRDLVSAALRRVLVAGIRARRARGDWRAVERLSAHCLAVDPLNEEATLALAEATAVHGGKRRAMGILDSYVREIGPAAAELRGPAALLRRRISEAAGPDASAVREPPFIGREAESAILHEGLEAARRGSGSTLHVWGEAGIGKTRLVSELIRSTSLRGGQVARVEPQACDARRPLSIFSDLVPKLLVLRGALGCSPDSMRYLRRLTERDPGAGSGDIRDPEMIFASVRRAVLDLLDAVASETCLVVVMENIQWLDAMSWSVLQEVSAWLRTRPMVLVVTSRDPEPAGAQIGRPLAARAIALAPLAEKSARTMLATLVSDTPRAADATFLDWCITTAGGNPYYLGELAVHGLREGETFRAPLALSQLAAERLARLTALSRRVLQACAVLGPHSTIDRVARALNERRLELLDSFDDLDRKGLVDPSDGRLVIRHELLAAAALEELSEAARAHLHSRVADALEAEVAADRSPALLWACADHWWHAGDRSRAITLVRECAAHSSRLGLPGEAADILKTAEGLDLTDGERVAIGEERLAALQLAGRWQELSGALPQLDEVRDRVNPDRPSHDAVELIALETQWRTGQSLRAIQAEALRCAQAEAAPAAHRVRAATLAVMLADNLCDPRSAGQAFGRAAGLFRQPDVDGATRSYLELVYHSSFGDLALAAQASRDLIVRAPAKMVAVHARYLRHAALALRHAGFVHESFSAALHAFHLASAHTLVGCAAAAACQLVSMYVHFGERDAAEQWYSAAIERVEETEDTGLATNVYSHGAELALGKGNFAEAERLMAASTEALGAAACPRASARSAALRWQLILQRGGEVRAVDGIRELSELHEQTKRATNQDLMAATLCKVLLKAGKDTEATRTARQFLTRYRRDRLPISARLREVCTVLGIVTPGARSGKAQNGGGAGRGR